MVLEGMIFVAQQYSLLWYLLIDLHMIFLATVHLLGGNWLYLLFFFLLLLECIHYAWWWFIDRPIRKPFTPWLAHIPLSCTDLYATMRPPGGGAMGVLLKSKVPTSHCKLNSRIYLRAMDLTYFMVLLQRLWVDSIGFWGSQGHNHVQWKQNDS